MLTVTRTHSHGAVVTLFPGLRTELAARREALCRARFRRATTRALAEMPDYILRDIGRERDGSAIPRDGI
jgi:uncharacterized protein YjiS (DUF1127 family)